MGWPNSNKASKIALRTSPGIVVKRDGASGLMGCDCIDMVWQGIAEAESSFAALMSLITYTSGSCWRCDGVVALTEKARDLVEESRSPGRAPIYTASGRSGHDNIRARSEVGRAYVTRFQCLLHIGNIRFPCEEYALECEQV